MAAAVQAQTPPHRGGFVPGQHRDLGDPAQIERGKTLYGINCAICHGSDLRGGDMGGPNLLRSQVALSDQKGELILPIIQGSRQNAGMPAINISPEDGLAVAAYVRSIMETIGVQGTPPSAGRPAPSVLVGDAKEGKAYFDAKCASCHSATGDLQGIATKIPDAKDLQTSWVRGHARGGGGREPDPVTVSIFLPNGEHVEGRLVHVDDFLVSVRLADGAVHSYARHGAEPKVEIHDPMQKHRDLLTQYNDRDIHDVTAFLATLK
jgi:cytochrome c oxidase cbb3-type subunit 3